MSMTWIALFAAYTLAGCGGGHGPGDAAVTLSVMLPPGERPFWEPIAASFEAEHPGVELDLIEGPQSTDLRENLYTTSLLAADSTFDLVYMDVTWTSKFAAGGWLLALDDSLLAPERERFLPAALGAGFYRGHLYRVPVRTDMGVLYYRRDWLEAAGLSPPETFDDLVEIAQRLQDPPQRWGFVWQGKQYEGLVCAFLEVLRGHGGHWIDAATLDVGLDREEAIESVRFLVRCIDPLAISPPGVTTYQEEESRRIFQDGRAVFLRNWPYAWRLAQKDDSPIKGKVGVMPMVHSPGQHSSGTLGGWGLGISAFSRHPALAMAFIRHATRLASEKTLCEPTGYAPAVRAAYDDPELLAANPFLADLLRMHEHAEPRPVIAGYALASDILQRHLSAALSGAVTPEQAMRAAARETRAMLGAQTAMSSSSAPGAPLAARASASSKGGS